MDVSRHDVTIQVAPGIQHLQIKQGVLINILGLAPDAGIGTESIISLARRHNALVAINGGYFEMAATFRGESVGALKIGGEWISEPEQRRAAIGLSMISGRVEAIIDRIELEIELVLQGDETLAIDGFNRARIENELILYRPIFHAVTLTDLDGVEVLVRDNHVVDIRDGQGSSRIPDDGYVLSANASKRDWLVAHLSVGDKICQLETKSASVRPLSPSISKSKNSGKRLSTSSVVVRCCSAGECQHHRKTIMMRKGLIASSTTDGTLAQQ